MRTFSQDFVHRYADLNAVCEIRDTDKTSNFVTVVVEVDVPSGDRIQLAHHYKRTDNLTRARRIVVQRALVSLVTQWDKHPTSGEL